MKMENEYADLQNSLNKEKNTRINLESELDDLHKNNQKLRSTK
jgi:predicted  nucleic acid-binding Zn-ribbon protein